MFTGIISWQGTVSAALGETGDGTLVVRTSLEEQQGNSVAVNGCCLTVADCGDGALAFDVIPETRAHTNLGQLAAGDLVNLEPALRAGDPLGGHIVQGHVDGVGTVTAVEHDDNALDVRIGLPPELVRYCVERGSITVNGVSLTVMGLHTDGVGVSLIPETRQRTNLGSLGPGDTVNIEVDVLARYVERLLTARP